eukprot:scaffold7203_cov416-Prasinococcus_capsulatus_cf.AAC.13
MFAAVATIEVAVGNIEVGIAHAVTLVWKKGGWAFNGRTRVRFAGYTRIAGLPTLVEHVPGAHSSLSVSAAATVGRQTSPLAT